MSLRPVPKKDGRKGERGKEWRKVGSLEYSMFFAEHSKQKRQRLRPMYIPIVHKKARN